ncbi:CPBP family intramembrane glutamic endopeptidase [Rhodalgimonas zhirmunskyi]|uniref:CPBP family intramembrane metalloprotease n=1 Tax=Rhodalgimonas zhirmunskyi TaxID=2964767 RepID=A0AAJ1U5E2_9RHOB|nr:CPBP family intramembrane glutamic endopeptidase [Rhodoalgimonas zhirmunskyi]MDQ2093940.1 CPBP family intramembrane metalloprotease [Rhodoalgimonas zhirmunskyi]
MPPVARRSDRYPAHRAFYAQAQKTPGFRPVILGFIIIETLYEMGQRLFGYGVGALAHDSAEDILTGRSALGLTISLASFVILTAATAFVLRAVHGRRLASLIAPDKAGRARALAQFASALPYILLLFLAVELMPPWWDASEIAAIRPPLLWMLWLIPGMAALLIQISAEELFYRGYLQQQIAAHIRGNLGWLVLPNIAFALAHWQVGGPALANTQYMIWAFTFGLAASDLTARAGTLGPALALHFANNAYAFLFYGEQGGPDSGLALLLFSPSGIAHPFEDTGSTEVLFSPALLSELGLTLLMWIAARIAIRR